MAQEQPKPKTRPSPKVVAIVVIAVLAAALGWALLQLPGLGPRPGTFPTVESVTSTSFPTDSTTHNVPMPSSVNGGDLLIAFIATDGTPSITTPGGWTWFFGWNGFGGLMKFSMYAKKADGTEGGTSVNFLTSAVQKAAAQVYRITGWRDSGNISRDIEWSNDGATSANPNPPSLNPTNWDVESTLWIAAYGADDDDDATAYPANYTNGTYTQSDNAPMGSVSMGSAWRNLAAASEDPETFTIGTPREWIGSALAVRPAAP